MDHGSVFYSDEFWANDVLPWQVVVTLRRRFAIRFQLYTHEFWIIQ